jgi:hypothetical protein
MRWSEVRSKLLPSSGVGVVGPWLVIAPGRNPVIRVDLRLLDSIRVGSDADRDSDGDEDATSDDRDHDRDHDPRSTLILSCNELEVALSIADGLAAVERLVDEALRFTGQAAGDRELPVMRGEPAPAHELPRDGRLVVLEPEGVGVAFDLVRPTMMIGRAEDNDIVLRHRSVSRTHARLTRDPETGRYTIDDLEATNTVRVNGQDRGRIELQHDDVVDLGHVRMQFVDPSSEFIIACDAAPSPASFVIVGRDAVQQHDDVLRIGTAEFHIAEVLEYARSGANLPLPANGLLQAAVALLVVAASEGGSAPSL